MVREVFWVNFHTRDVRSGLFSIVRVVGDIWEIMDVGPYYICIICIHTNNVISFQIRHRNLIYVTNVSYVYIHDI